MANATKNTETPVAATSAPAQDERQYGKTQEHVWVLSGTGTEIHKKYDGVKLRQRLAGYGRTPQEAMDNMLALTGGNWHAVTDNFNNAFRLAAQKDTKELTATKKETTKDANGKETTRTIEPTATVDQLQNRILSFVGQETNRKGTGAEAKRKVEKEKATLLDQLTATDDDDAALDLLRQIRERRAAMQAARG